MGKVENVGWVDAEAQMERVAAERAKSRTNTERWNRDSTVFAYSILLIVILLLNNGVNTTIVSVVGIAGLFLIWLMGREQGKQLFKDIYREEKAKLQHEITQIAEQMEGQTIEEKVRQAMREIFR